LNTFNFVGGGVHLSDDEVVGSSELFGEFNIHWSHFFTMTAPWGVIFNKDILGSVTDDILPVESDDLNDSRVLGLWDWFTLNVLVKVSSLEILEKLDHTFRGHVTVVDEFFEVSTGWIDDPDLWEVTSNTDVVSKPLVETINNTRGGHENVSFELGRSFSEGVHSSIASFTIFSEEEEALRSTAEDHLGGFLVEWHDSSDGLGADPLVESFGGHFTFPVVSTFIKLFEKGDTVTFLTEFSGEVSIEDVMEDQIVMIFRDGLPGSEISGVFSSEEDDDDVVSGSSGFDGLGGFEEGSGWLSFLGDPLDDSSGISWTLIVNWGSIDEKFKSWISLDLESLTEGFLFSSIDHSDSDFGAFISELLSSSFVVWLEFFAVTAPRGIKHN